VELAVQPKVHFIDVVMATSPKRDNGQQKSSGRENPPEQFGRTLLIDYQAKLTPEGHPTIDHVSFLL
jgi:hypothetical protein